MLVQAQVRESYLFSKRFLQRRRGSQAVKHVLTTLIVFFGMPFDRKCCFRKIISPLLIKLGKFLNLRLPFFGSISGIIGIIGIRETLPSILGTIRLGITGGIFGFQLLFDQFLENRILF